MADENNREQEGMPCRCEECEKEFAEEETVKTENGVFCKTCYDRLLSELDAIVKIAHSNINYTQAAIGAVIGGAVGVLCWWGFTYLTKYAFGLIAIVIGIAVAKGIELATGGKRSKGLQALAVGVTFLAYFYADYLVTRSFVIAENAQVGAMLSIIPHPLVFLSVEKLNMNMMSLVFLGIALWQAYHMTRPILPSGVTVTDSNQTIKVDDDHGRQ